LRGALEQPASKAQSAIAVPLKDNRFIRVCGVMTEVKLTLPVSRKRVMNPNRRSPGAAAKAHQPGASDPLAGFRAAAQFCD
jgi:hypothetical protein